MKNFEEFVNESFSSSKRIKFDAIVKKQFKEFLKENREGFEKEVERCVNHWKEIYATDPINEDDNTYPDMNDPIEMLNMIEDMKDQSDDWGELYKEFNDDENIGGIYEDFLDNILDKIIVKEIKRLENPQDWLTSNWEYLSNKIKKAFPEMSRGKKSGMWEIKTK